MSRVLGWRDAVIGLDLGAEFGNGVLQLRKMRR